MRVRRGELGCMSEVLPADRPTPLAIVHPWDGLRLREGLCICHESFIKAENLSIQGSASRPSMNCHVGAMSE